MTQTKRKKKIQALYSSIFTHRKKAKLEELKIRKIIELRRDKSIAHFKEKFGFNLKVQHIKIIE